MVDSRAKGATAETKARDELRKGTGLKWERTPGSGALDPKHGLKGDLYVPMEKNLYCVEVKHYKDDHLTSKILTHKDPQLLIWWRQTLRQGRQMNKKPLLIFKYDRSKWYCGFSVKELNMDDEGRYKHIKTYISIHPTDELPVVVCPLDNFLKWKCKAEDWILA